MGTGWSRSRAFFDWLVFSTRDFPNLFLVSLVANMNIGVYYGASFHYFLCSVMDKIDISTRITLVRLYYENGSSAAAALRAYKTIHHLRADPFCVTSIQRLIKRFEKEGSVLDRPRSGRPSTSDDVVEQVQQVLQYGQASSRMNIFSARAVSRQSGLPKTTVLRALKSRLNMHPYRVRLLQELKETDYQARVDFANWFLDRMDEDGFQERVLWTDEAHFNLDGSLCNKNCVIWSKDNPCTSVTTSLHPQRVTVWCGFTSRFILPPAFLENGDTVNAERYLHILKEHMLPNLPRHKKNIIFMQDGAPPHVANIVKTFLKDRFGDDIISRHFPQPWPPRSPDLNPCDFFLWGHLKSRVFLHDPKSVDELKRAIQLEILRIDGDVLVKTVDNLFDRLLCELATNGRHIE
jgi:transposase